MDSVAIIQIDDGFSTLYSQLHLIPSDITAILQIIDKLICGLDAIIMCPYYYDRAKYLKLDY